MKEEYGRRIWPVKVACLRSGVLKQDPDFSVTELVAYRSTDYKAKLEISVNPAGEIMMECPYCKEVIKDKAIKCHKCSEFVRFGFIPGSIKHSIEFLIALVTLSSLIFAFQQSMHAKEERQRADTATEETKQTMAILEEMSRDNVLNSAKTQVDPQIFNNLQQRNFVEVERQLQARLKENPKDEQARRGLIYSRVLRRAQ